MNYSLNNNVNINSSEYHTNNTYKYFQSSNGINLRKKNKNKANFITDNSHIFLNPSKKSITKKKISKDKLPKKGTISKKALNISPSPSNNNNPSSRFSKKLLSGSLNQLTSDNINEKNNNWNQVQKISFSDRIFEGDNEKIKNLEKENEKLKKENDELNKKNKELIILVNKLENEILEIKSVIKDNLNMFLQPEKDMINKSYNELSGQIEKEKENISKILNQLQQKENSNIETESKSREDNLNININNKNLLNEGRNNFRIFQKNYFEFFNQVNTSNTLLNGYPAGNDQLKNILNSFCCFMDNIMNKLEKKFIHIEKDKNEKNIDNSNYNFIEICLINIYYQFVISQLFLVSFFERQHCYYCFSILDYILTSPFMIIKNNNFIKNYTRKITNLIEVYRRINEEYISKFSEQTFFYLDNYIKLFNIIINNKSDLINNIKLDTDVFKQNTEVLFDKDNNKDDITKNKIIYKKKVKVALTRGEPAFHEAAEELRNTEPMPPLEFVPELCIPLPETDEEIKDSVFLKNQVLELRKEGIRIDVFFKDLVKIPEVSALLMIVDDNGKNAGKKRSTLLNREFKYIGVNCKFIGKTFIAYLGFSK